MAFYMIIPSSARSYLIPQRYRPYVLCCFFEEIICCIHPSTGIHRHLPVFYILSLWPFSSSFAYSFSIMLLSLLPLFSVLWLQSLAAYTHSAFLHE